MTDHKTMEHEVEEAPETEASPPEAPRHEAHYAPPPVAPPAVPHVPHAPAPAPANERTPLLAALFSIFPGLGNVYNGLYMRGVTFFLICIGLVGLSAYTEPPEAVLLVFAVIFTWLFNLFDAYRQATLINLGYPTDPSLDDRPQPSTYGSGGMMAGIAVFLLGFYGLLREVFNISLAVLADYWYLLFMAFGGFLIVQTLLQKRRKLENADEI